MRITAWKTPYAVSNHRWRKPGSIHQDPPTDSFFFGSAVAFGYPMIVEMKQRRIPWETR